MKTIVDLTEELKEYSLEKDTAAKQAVEANIAPVEADASSASRAYVVGEQLFLNDVLYDVTSPISVGDAIVVNTNITAANKLSADIKSKIDDLYSKNQAFMKQITVNGAVNELDHTGVTDTSGTVIFTVNEDKSITVSANSYPVTLDSTTTFFFFGTNSTAVPNIFKGKKFVGCPSGGASGTYRIAIQEFSSTTPSGAVAESSDVGEGANISNGDYIRMYIRLGSGYQLTSALTFKPMISLPELGLSYDDYVPYAKTNQELTAENQTLTNQVKDMNNVLGAKNLLPISLKYLKSINTNGTWNDNAYTIDGVTYTVNTDSQGSIVNITTSGTASTNSALNIYGTNTSYGENNFSGMILNGCPSGGGTAGTDYRIVAFIGNSQDGTGHITINDTGDGATLTNASYLRIYLRVPNGYSSSLVFKPMIRLASITDDTYEPYAKTNQQLTEDSVTWDNLSEVGAVNYLKYPYYNTTREDGGLTYTDNGDGTINISAGTTTDNSGFWFEHHSTNVMKLDSLIGKTVKFSVDMSSPYTELNTSNARIELRVQGSSSTLISENVALNQSHNEFVFTVPSGAVHLQALVWIASGKTLPATKMSPMLAPVSYNGPYVPYAKTNKELTDDVADIAYEALTDYGSSEYTLTEGKMWQTKGVTFLFVAVKCNTVSPISGGSHIKIAEIPSKFKKPQFDIYPCIANYKDGSTHIGAQLQIGEAGQIAIRGGETGASYAGLFSF